MLNSQARRPEREYVDTRVATVSRLGDTFCAAERNGSDLRVKDSGRLLAAETLARIASPSLGLQHIRRVFPLMVYFIE